MCMMSWMPQVDTGLPLSSNDFSYWLHGAIRENFSALINKVIDIFIYIYIIPTRCLDNYSDNLTP